MKETTNYDLGILLFKRLTNYNGNPKRALNILHLAMDMLEEVTKERDVS